MTLDALTYAGNLANLEPVLASPRHRFVRGDVADPAAVASALAGGVDAIVNFAAESHVDRSIDDAEDVPPYQRGRHPGAARRRARRRRARFAPGVDRRGVRQPRPDRRVHRGERRSARAARTRRARRPPISSSLAAHHTHATRRGDHPLLEQLRPVPVPGEADPALHHQRARRRAAAALRRRPERARLDPRRATIAARSIVVLRRGRAGEVYNIGGGNERRNEEIAAIILRRRSASRRPWCGTSPTAPGTTGATRSTPA